MFLSSIKKWFSRKHNQAGYFNRPGLLRLLVCKKRLIGGAKADKIGEA
jgi:hypothetical protein